MNILKPYLALRRVKRVFFIINMLIVLVIIGFVTQSILIDTWRSGETLAAKIILVLSYIQCVTLPIWMILEITTYVAKTYPTQSIRDLYQVFFQVERDFLNTSHKTFMEMWRAKGIISVNSAPPKRVVSRFQLGVGIDVVFDLVLVSGGLKPTFSIICFPEHKDLSILLCDFLALERRKPLWRKNEPLITLAKAGDVLWIKTDETTD